ncbi:ABC transporter B family member 29 [Arabidopsis thaliana]|uniref:ABC transporter B family member 29, chloroplastic n=4 Tax=Arabidopsis TaxID=3701 RepID=AB29B_ARATH|nr:ABC2 homolog 12 [Arabidopsis thaliana]Q9LZB8.1 RecName: Full=ABC transporter B family member 29, chloroplastic; Short=ABC transporter ABCB.29; Short=AtABCB29; AltName: Full=ABC2 homolog 12; Flags: Precursor [Arabidopsis thaliana]KAG7601081.1 ABC transporter-like [Arabidopsis thaliana x Arabidopsis arenosa]KAG7608029.1 ABC transporter-like [Arabidopsis suecica]AAL24084.1 putative ABC transporter protein [Arabidopsis thaliana]AAM14304.1 putative ABC transporter [Arabidopsis thaliana]AED90671|eukprot:NP_196011.1 ABC2 homolog 12 [Arabidopsis thaliana]
MSFLLLTPPPCLLIPPPPLSHRRSSSLFLKHPFQPSPRPLSFCKPSALRLRANTTVNSLKALETIKPYLQSESKTVLLGWLCSCVSVVSLSQIVPRLGSFTSNLNANAASLTKLKGECLVLAGLVLAKVVAYYLQQAFLWEAALNTVYKIRVFAYRRVLERELEFFEGGNGISSGDIAYRITAEASEVADTIYALLNTVVPSAIQISVMTAHMIVASPALTLVSAMVIPSVALLIAYLGDRLRKISRKAQIASAQLSTYLNEVLPAILFVKANNAEISESVRFQRFARADLDERFKKKKMKSLIPQIVQVMYLGSLSIFCVGAVILAGSSLSSSAIVSFVASLAFLIDPVQDLGKAYNELKQGEPAIERLFDLTSLESKVIERPEAIQLEKVAGEVELCDISFKYDENMLPVLDGLNLHIKAGETVALVGPSGGGKTTLIKLLLRLYEPSSGSIIIDKIDIKDIKLESLRKHVGLVSQDTTLFSGTIADNIGYRDLTTGIDMKRVELAAKTANADEFIRNLPEGYNTGVGPRGSSLSGGQKQRLAIARALYQKSSILILDEATSALDSLSELLVREALERVMQDHTVIVIAHRLETVMMAQRVFLVERGKLKELNRSSLLSTHKDSLTSAGLVI